MYYELYIDLFFLENFMMDSLLLFSVNRILNCGRKAPRILLVGAGAGIFTCLIVAAPVSSVCKMILFHFFVNSLMLTAGLGVRKPGRFARAMLLLYLNAFLLGGILSAFRPYLRTAGIFYGAAVLVWLILEGLRRGIACLDRRKEKMTEVTLFADHTQIRLKALWDTGNMLTDPVSADPVNILDPDVLKQIPGPAEERKLRYIPYRCVGAEGVMPVFRIDKICVHDGTDRWVREPLIGVSRETLSEKKRYQMILNPDTFG